MSEFGIEEEFLLVDRHSLLPALSKSSLQEVEDAVSPSSGEACAEWLPGQIEFATPVLTTADEAVESLHAFRRSLSTASRARDLFAVGLGTAPQISGAPAGVSDGSRYREFADLAPGIAADQYVNGMHVHVDIPDREAGLRALNGLRRWIPVLTALSANSPLWRGADSGFASWRSIHYRRWVVFGIPPHFHDLDDYDAQIAAALRSDVVFDEATLGWLVRLSPTHRTGEPGPGSGFCEIRGPDDAMLADGVEAPRSPICAVSRCRSSSVTVGAGAAAASRGMSSVDTAEVPSIGDAAPIVSQVPTLGLLSSVFSIRPRQGPPMAPDGGFPSLPAGPRGELSLQCRVDFSSAMRAVSPAMSSP